MEPLRSFLLLTWYKMGKKSSRFLLLDGQTTCNHFGNMTAPPPQTETQKDHRFSVYDPISILWWFCLLGSGPGAPLMNRSKN